MDVFILVQSDFSDINLWSFCLFILFMGFSRQEYWSGLPFPSPVDHILSELYTMTCPSWVALQGMAHSFTELDMAVAYLIRLVSFLWLWFSFCLPSDGEGWGLWKLPDGRDWLREKLGLVLLAGAMLSKSLIQFSVDGWSCVNIKTKYFLKIYWSIADLQCCVSFRYKQSDSVIYVYICVCV